MHDKIGQQKKHNAAAAAREPMKQVFEDKA
jgi:hypothetical protein